MFYKNQRAYLTWASWRPTTSSVQINFRFYKVKTHLPSALMLATLMLLLAALVLAGLNFI